MRAIVALGSNLGNREKNIVAAVSRMAPLANGEIRLSTFFRSAAEDMGDAPDFVNAVVVFETTLDPHELLHSLQEVEIALGRPRDHARNASRTIDLDIICYGDLKIADDELTIPHPRAHERDFVMVPLREVAPDVSLG